MKRFHVHVGVRDLAASIRFYSSLFDAEPTVVKSDYAKWMLEDPRINFAISERGAAVGVNHLGIQVDSAQELKALRDQVAAADLQARDEPDAACCYARSDKYWVQDPQGVAWETFHTLGRIPVFGERAASEHPATGACCAPETPVAFVQRPDMKTCCS
ncbi:MAG TPA: ArsI/CadI family heavy metal resistance metalloenzyme [Burkholderiaceae bacterium]|jgi:lactoylglutathione lyase|nr:ArsI/CadI family heavy metal resistance metalloenzyme [Burkholderiaceae bacterium]